jgi:transcriptional regulator with XRE-family HTH domain
MWRLKDWMQARGLSQADMIRLTGWPKSTMSQLYNGSQDFNPRLIREACEALELEAYELFMLPAEAEAIRQLKAVARTHWAQDPQ